MSMDLLTAPLPHPMLAVNCLACITTQMNACIPSSICAQIERHKSECSIKCTSWLSLRPCGSGVLMHVQPIGHIGVSSLRAPGTSACRYVDILLDVLWMTSSAFNSSSIQFWHHADRAARLRKPMG